MSNFFKSLMGKLRIADDDNTEDEFYDEDDFDMEEDEAAEEKPSFDTRPVIESGYEEERAVSRKTLPFTSKRSTRVSSMSDHRTNSIINVIKPSMMSDAKEITERLRENRSVLLNLEGIDMDLAQRLLDFASGTCYAIDGDIKRITSYIYVCIPNNVEVAGAVQDMLNGAFEDTDPTVSLYR